MARLVSCCVLFLFKDMPTQCDWTVIRLQLPGLAGQLPERVALASSDWLGGVPRQSNEKGLDEKETRRGRRRRTGEREERERKGAEKDGCECGEWRKSTLFIDF